MESGDAWRMLFDNWPQSIPRQGMLVTKFQESIPFIDFLVSPAIVLLDRGKPDAMGARKVMVAFSQVAGLKLAGTQEMEDFQAMGFQAPFY